jgi:hypothetical protein
MPASRLLSISVLLFALANGAAQSRYFPEKTFGSDPQSDHFVAHWYATQLKALGEPSLLERSKDPSAMEFRFLWLRTFHHPVAIRVAVNSDGTGRLITKIADGAGGYEPGRLVTNSSVPLTPDETKQIVRRIESSDFWSLPSHLRENGGMDGSEWVIEAAARGRYHLVSVWTPKKGTIYDLGKFFLFELDKMAIPKDEFY